MTDITDRQLEMLTLIARSMAEKSMPPTVRELGDAMGIRSTNAVNDILKCLVRSGYVERPEMKARAIIITPKGFKRLGAKLPLVEAATLALRALEATGSLDVRVMDVKAALRRVGIR